MLFIKKFGGYKTDVKERYIESRETLLVALRSKVNKEKCLGIHGGLRE